jgi:hypothetical protein
LGDFPNGPKELKKEQMYLKAFLEKVAIVEQKHALEKVGDKRSKLISRASSFKKIHKRSY